jgi:hypothetical protein
MATEPRAFFKGTTLVIDPFGEAHVDPVTLAAPQPQGPITPP